MKDFNIEQLAKKIPYKIPENTFEEMQENVLNKTVRKKEHQPKIFKINFSNRKSRNYNRIERG